LRASVGYGSAVGSKFGFVAGLWVIGCAAASRVPEPAPKVDPDASRPTPALAAIPASPPPSAAPAASTPAPSDAGPLTAEPTLDDRLQALRDAGLAPLAEIIARRVTQQRRKMKLTEDEAQLVAQELLQELPGLARVRALSEAMPKASIELVRSTRERGVPGAEAERIAIYLLEVRTQLAMDNPTPFDENCSHVVGREWQDIDYRDEGMTWQRQQSIYLPKGVPNFKTVANIRQFFRVESNAPYFQKLYQVKGSVL
jgi:hypothetical protein